MIAGKLKWKKNIRRSEQMILFIYLLRKLAASYFNLFETKDVVVLAHSDRNNSFLIFARLRIATDTIIWAGRFSTFFFFFIFLCFLASLFFVEARPKKIVLVT